MSRVGVFLDRDGTINVEKAYLYRREDWEWIPGAVEAIRQFNRQGLLTVVVTNQAGVGRGYYQEDDVLLLHAHVRELLSREGAHIDAFYYCPHRPEPDPTAQCRCRKPAPGLLLQAKQDLDVDLDRSFLVGDKAIDVFTAKAAGVTPILVTTGYGEEHRNEIPADVLVVPDVLAAQRWIEGAVRPA
jgi:D-glycero-D-manno-heptose 1,7-bisphosphate phosphatase